MSKQRAVVIDIQDPEKLGRIRARLVGAQSGANITPWAWPCSPLASNGSGFFCMPVVGDRVWVEVAADGSWVYTGFCWTASHAVPEDGSDQSRVFKTPAGHQIKFDDAGDIEITHSTGSRIVLSANGNVTVAVTDGQTIDLGGNATEPVLLGQSFQQIFNDLVDFVNEHTHQVPQASSGMLESQAPTSSAGSSNASDLSTKVWTE